MVIFQRTVDYSPNDDVKVIPKFRRDYVPDGIDPLTMEPIVKVDESKDDHDLSKQTVVVKTEEVKQEPTGYKCNICDYECATEKGMQIHIGKAHKEK